jgi:hypothetical protein
MRDVRHTGTFTAEDYSGNPYVIDIYTEYQEITTFGGTEVHEGRRSLVTSDGQPVNRKGRGQYQIVTTGELLASNDPNAP